MDLMEIVHCHLFNTRKVQYWPLLVFLYPQSFTEKGGNVVRTGLRLDQRNSPMSKFAGPMLHRDDSFPMAVGCTS